MAGHFDETGQWISDDTMPPGMARDPGGWAPGSTTTTDPVVGPAGPGGTTPAVADPAAAPAVVGAAPVAASTAGAYAAPTYTGGDTGDYGKWMNELQRYQTLAPTAGGSDTAQFDTMMAATHAGQYLSPYAQALMRGQLGQAHAAYDVASALGGTPTPTQAGSAAPMNFAQYMQDALLRGGNEGRRMSGFGTYNSGLPYMKALTDIIAAGHAGTGYAGGINGSPALDAAQTADVWRRYNDTAGRQTLQQDLGVGVQGPFAAYRRGQISDLTNPGAEEGAGGTDAWLKQLQDWERQAYGG